MKTLGMGISNKDLDKIKTDVNYRKKFIGKILLQVESRGEAYYISFDGRYNYLKDGASAYEVMKKLGMGISNTNLNKIKVNENVLSQVKNNTSSSTSLIVDIRFPKNVFNASETLKCAGYYLKYAGAPFKGLILYGESREGLIETSYSATRGIIQTGDFDQGTIPYMKASIYSIKPDGTPNSFDCNGTYKYSISVYDCVTVDKVMGTNDCGSGGWPPTIDASDIFAKVLPLKTMAKNISVQCDNGSTSCCTNEAYRCTQNAHCLSGYGCVGGQCVKK